MQDILSKILLAKEQRQAIRQGIGNMGYATISINFNIPGYPKTDTLLSKIFILVNKELENFLKAHRISFKEQQIKTICDEAGDISFFPLIVEENTDYKAIKDKLEQFEESHPLGRMLDVDLFDHTQKSISSHKQKSCFICKNKPALHCMREQNHTYEALRTHISRKAKKYYTKIQEEHICHQLASTALWAIFTEVSLPGKPGLVSPDGNGSHTDMNYHTFLASTSAISSYFYKIAEMGYRWNARNKQETVIQLRTIGLQMEADMFKATQGVNTQKGIVFLIIFSLFTSAYTLKKYQKFNADTFQKVLKKLNKDLVEKELSKNIQKPLSNGEQCFRTFGKKLAGGIRQEVEEGLPIFFNEIQFFMQNIDFSDTDCSDKAYFENQCKRILIKIMSVNNDTNILFRSDAKTLYALQEKAKKVLSEHSDLNQNTAYQELLRFCKEKNISPGGSADLLAISLFLHKVSLMS